MYSGPKYEPFIASEGFTFLGSFNIKWHAAKAAPSAPPVDTGVDRAIEIMHEIERGVMDALRSLGDRLSMVEQRLDIEAKPHEPVDANAVQDLAAYLRQLDQRVSEADAHARAAEDEARRAVASRAAIPQPEAKRPPSTLAEAKADALDRIRAAGRARRDAVIGGSADARDTLARLATVALDARIGNREVSLEQMARLASTSGEDKFAYAKRIIGEHDTATEVVVQTLALERRGEQLLAPHMTQAAIEGEVEIIIAAINRVGEQ